MFYVRGISPGEEAAVLALVLAGLDAGGGHDAIVAQPEAVTERVLRFLEE